MAAKLNWQSPQREAREVAAKRIETIALKFDMIDTATNEVGELFIDLGPAQTTDFEIDVKS